MFDYSVLTERVRRLLDDEPKTYIDTREDTARDSYFVLLSNDGYATVHPSGFIVNGVVLADDSYTVDRNLIHVEVLIPADAEVVVHYDMVQYTDQNLLNAIDDCIHTVVEPVFNTDFEFGVDTTSETITNQDIDRSFQALFTHGAVLLLKGIQLSETAGDAIYIKDGDTTIDTAASSREAARGYEPVLERWNELLKTIRINKFGGVVMY